MSKEKLLINNWTEEKVIKHIQENFKGRAVEGSQCAYRTSDGKRCIAGLFMSDQTLEQLEEQNLMTDSIDGKSVWDVAENDMPLSMPLMERWQGVHDGIKDHQIDLQEQKDILIKYFKEMLNKEY